MEGLLVLFIFFGLPIIITVLSQLKTVPPNTTIIIDRNSHFHKKKRHGFYMLNPRTDKVTTKVSEYPIKERYSNVFKTHEDTYYNVTFTMTYVCKEPEQTLESLSDSRRSIYDIANCAVETLFGTLSPKDLVNYRLDELSPRLFHQLEATLEYFYIDVTDAYIIDYSLMGEERGRELLFRRHESTSGDPIQ